MRPPRDKTIAPALKWVLTGALLLFAAAPLTSAQPFTHTSPNIHGLQGSSVAADFDNDGRLDILEAGHDTLDYYTFVWHNIGGGGFSDVADLYPTGFGAVAAGDFFNTGRLDALVTGLYYSTASSQLWQNLGSNNFNLITNSMLPGIKNGYVAVGDFDNDGKLDIMLWGTGALQISRNLGNGVFTNMNAGIRAIGTPSSVTGVFATDFDNDGYLDVLVGKALWHNLGNGTFTNLVSGLPGGATAIGDFDNDGYMDVLVGGQVWRNLHDGTFTNWGAGFAATGQSVGDFNNDGLLDVLALNSSSTVWQSLGGGNFTNVQTMTNDGEGGGLWGDFNGDGRLDFFVSGAKSFDSNSHPIYGSDIWQGTVATTNAPPTAPTNPTFQIKGNGGVKLMWGAATDDHTPASGLNYNIRVSTTPGGLDVVSPEANPLTGQRLVVQIGNAQERLFSLLTNLTGGTYYWSVQAIDTAFAGGAFATESTFVIPPTINGAVFTNGQFQVAFNALATNSYTLQASTNLSAWVAVTNLIPASNGPVSLTDTNTLLYPRRYYRVSVP